MPILSATEAIAPALERTRRLLFQPFSWRTFLKLCAVALFTEGLFSTFRAGKGGPPSGGARTGGLYYTIPAEWMVALIIAAAVVVLVVLALLYLSTRLRFALFDCLVRQRTRILPGWRAYRDASLRFFGLCIVVGLTYLVVAGAVLFQFVASVIRILHSHQGRPLPPQEVFGLLWPLVPLVIVLVAAAILIDIVLRDFMLPHIALDNASAREAWQEVWDRVTLEPGSFFLYAVLRVLLPLAALVGLFLVLALPTFVVFAGPVLLMEGLHAAIAQASVGAAMFFRGVEVLVWLFMIAVAVLIAIAFGGPLCIALRNYALLFYGGRYSTLGDLLSPPLARPRDLP